MSTDCEEEDDFSRSQSPMIPLTIENSKIDIKAEPCDMEADFLEAKHEEEEDSDDDEDCLNSSLTPMDWLPKLNARAGVVEEFIPEEERKPPYSYASLIRLAILNSPGQKATLSDIYKWIQEHFLYYKNQVNLGWKNSIRHNLSLNKCFMKVARSRHDPGKGCYWAINHLYTHDKTPFRKKTLVLPNQLKQEISDLQRSFLQTLQTQQQLHCMAAEPSVNNNILTSMYPEQDMVIQQMSEQHVAKQETNSTCSPMLLDDWATTSESDLSPSLSRYMSSSASKDSALTGTCQPHVSKVAVIPELWPVKSEANPSSLFNCVDPMDVQTSCIKPSVSPPISDILLSTSSSSSETQPPCKLPSLWSDMGRMSWLGANLDLFDWSKLRDGEVPETGDCDADDLINIDYDKLM